MSILLSIALRNVTRNKYRSAITISAIGIGLACLIFIRAFVDGSHHQMIENYTGLLSGHIQIHSPGFKNNMALENSLKEPESIITSLKNVPQVIVYSLRIKQFVLASSAENSVGILLLGVEPNKEKQITKLHERIRQGNYLSADTDVVIGKDLAKALKVNLNDKIVLVGQGYDGSIASGAYRVCGILDTGAEELDKNLALISLNASQELFGLEGMASEIAIRTISAEHATNTTNLIKQKLNAQNNLEILSWKEISPMIVQWVEFDVAFVNIILFIVLIVVAAGILNTLLMGILERTREFGIMLALGTKRIQIIKMVTLESLILGICGTLIGLLFGILSSLYFSQKGIDLTIFSTALNNYYTGSIIYTKISFNYLFNYCFIVLIASLVISLYPAWRAANLKPVDAIYKN